MKKMRRNKSIDVFLTVFFLILFGGVLYAQTYECLPFATFDEWVVRYIDESKILGGQKSVLYAIGPTDTIEGNIPYESKTSPWGSSNVLAEVAGITKTTLNMSPIPRGKGYAVEMVTSLMEFKILKTIQMKVITASSIYLGAANEPVKSTKDPYKNIDMGIPFTKRPKALVMDYKADLNLDGMILEASGRHTSSCPGKDPAQCFLLLQKRWEDEKGQIYAKRIGTASCLIHQNSEDWVNDFRMPVQYGKPVSVEGVSFVTHLSDILYAKNSKGQMSTIKEVDWAEADETPTHLIVFISSGSRGAFWGCEGSKLAVDNIRLEY